MNASSAFADHCLDLFGGLGPVDARAMFGGLGFFLGRAMFAIGDADAWRVWLKTDEATRPAFEAAGGVPFRYAAKGRGTTTMSFFTVPDAAMEEAEAMLPWARLALEAAERAAAKRRVKPRPKAKPPASRRTVGRGGKRPRATSRPAGR